MTVFFENTPDQPSPCEVTTSGPPASNRTTSPYGEKSISESSTAVISIIFTSTSRLRGLQSLDEFHEFSARGETPRPDLRYFSARVPVSCAQQLRPTHSTEPQRTKSRRKSVPSASRIDYRFGNQLGASDVLLAIGSK